MDITQYFTHRDGAVSFDEEQASDFAKGVAGDFNPIHDPGGKRFCVPGDLLFAVLLHHYGLSHSTTVQFSGMLDSSTRMLLPADAGKVNHIVDSRERALLTVFFDGRRYTNPAFIAQLSEQYVKFSGQTFPDILVPLMRSAGVMINPARPLVIYKDMAIELDDSADDLLEQSESEHTRQGSALPSDDLTLQLADTDISVNGRKGAVRLQFTIALSGEPIGRGEKNMVLSGLRDYEEPAMQEIVKQYNDWRNAYQEPEHAV